MFIVGRKLAYPARRRKAKAKSSLAAFPETLLKAPGLLALPGRLERYECDGVHIFIDYAHTDCALESVLKSLNRFVSGSIITVFGAGGDRDKTKRPRMGHTAQKYSDIIIITSDNPRKENPMSIIDDILDGVVSNERVFIEPDRKEAIEKALGIAKSNDVVLIAGKGHENYQIIGDTKYHFSDREIVINIIGKAGVQ
jgi:UDP-N-acetylmuramoyl-L-alanyl-D-glutamate--2,6-diaminopimelate ligase